MQLHRTRVEGELQGKIAEFDIIGNAVGRGQPRKLSPEELFIEWGPPIGCPNSGSESPRFRDIALETVQKRRLSSETVTGAICPISPAEHDGNAMLECPQHICLAHRAERSYGGNWVTGVRKAA
jgi:hypothetical protein